MVIAETLEQLRPLLGPQPLYEEFLEAPEGSIQSFVEDGEIIFSSKTEYRIARFAIIVPADYPKLPKVSIKLRAGNRICPRYGVGEDVGQCLFSAANYDDVVTDIVKMCSASPVEIEQGTNA